MRVPSDFLTMNRTHFASPKIIQKLFFFFKSIKCSKKEKRMKGDKGGLLFCWLYAEYAGIQPRNCISDALASNEYFDCLSVFRFRCRHLIYRLDLFCVFPPPFILMSYEFFFIFYFQLIHSICFIFRTLRKRQKKNEWGKVKKKKKSMKRK